MSLQTCIAEAKAWAEKNSELKLRGPEIEELGKLLQAANDAGATQPEKMKLMQDAVLKRIEATQQAQRGENYLNALKRAQNTSNIKKNIELWGNSTEAPADALEALTTGKSSKPGFGVNNDPLAASRANYTRYLENLENALTPANLKILKALDKTDQLSFKITQELGGLRENPPRVGVSGSDIAMQIAKGMREAQDATFKEMQASNPYLKENELYLFGRAHNPELIRKVPQAEWIKDIQASYGKNLIGSQADIENMLAKTYKEIVSGLPPEGATSSGARFWEPQGTGGSLAVRNSRSRVFVANSPEAEFAYNAKYGDSLYNAYVKQAQRAADYVATTTKWGTKAAENFDATFRAVENLCTTPEQRQNLLNRKADLKMKFEITQASRSNEAWWLPGRMAQTLMNAENLSMLGNHVPRILTSGPAMLSQIRSGYGTNIFEHSTLMAQSMARAVISNFGEEGKAAAKELGVSFTSVARDNANQIALGNGEKIGLAAKAARVMSSLTLADRFTNTLKFAMADADARQLGRMADTPFEKLNPRQQELLRRYDLGDQRWEVMRQAVQNGRIVPENFKALSDQQIAPLLTKVSPQEAMRLRGELAQNLGTLINERASMTVGESNSASRAQAYGLTDMNSAWGVTRNFLAQFRQASIVRQQLLQRTFRSGGGNISNISGVMQHMLGMAFMGMVGQQLIELGKGNEPMDVSDPKIIAHMIKSTGLLGYFGDIAADFLTAPEPNAKQRLIEGDFLGPSFGTLSKGVRATAYTLQGIKNDYDGVEKPNQYGQKQWAQLLHSLTPGQNIFYLTGALNHSVFKNGHEFMGDTGYAGILTKQMRESKNLFGETRDSNFYGD